MLVVCDARSVIDCALQQYARIFRKSVYDNCTVYSVQKITTVSMHSAYRSPHSSMYYYIVL